MIEKEILNKGNGLKYVLQLTLAFLRIDCSRRAQILLGRTVIYYCNLLYGMIYFPPFNIFLLGHLIHLVSMKIMVL